MPVKCLLLRKTGLNMQLGHSVSLPYTWKAPGPLSNTKKKNRQHFKVTKFFQYNQYLYNTQGPDDQVPTFLIPLDPEEIIIYPLLLDFFPCIVYNHI